MSAVLTADRQRLAAGTHDAPHDVLGPHQQTEGSVTRLAVRTWQPDATEVFVIAEGTKQQALSVGDGLFEAILERTDVPDYHLTVDGQEAEDPYRFLPTLGELDLHLLAEGRHERLWTVLGAHRKTYDSPRGPLSGTSFAVWAPSAKGVRLACDTNGWDSRRHPMRRLTASGTWELFVPGIGVGERYQFHILGADGVWRMKADPYAFATVAAPDTNSVVSANDYLWTDEQWMKDRAAKQPWQEPMTTYEVHLGSWKRHLSYRQLADELPAYVAAQGFTHVEMMPPVEHPFYGSWGYQVSAYFAPSSRYGVPDDFRALVDAFHAHGIAVIVDWVPAHFPKDEWSLGRFDGTPLYEYADPQRGEHPDWGTYVFDHGRPEVRAFLISNALWWLEEMHVDGLRVDAVASMLHRNYSRSEGQWTPNVRGGVEDLEAEAFLQEVNLVVGREHPGTAMIAEESSTWPGVTRAVEHGGLGFMFKWNMGWMNDTLDYVSRDPIHRRWHHNDVTFASTYQFSENFVLPLSHDEVVHGKRSLAMKAPGDQWQRLATLRALLGHMYGQPGKKLLFMGAELGQEREWSHERSLDWDLLGDAAHEGVQHCLRDLNTVLKFRPALFRLDGTEGGFFWLDADDADNNLFAWARRSGDDDAPDGGLLVCIVNYSPTAHEHYRVGLPRAGSWREVMNTDQEAYGGSGVVNTADIETAENWSHQGQPHSAIIRVPPLGTVWLEPVPTAVPALVAAQERAAAVAAAKPAPRKKAAEPLAQVESSPTLKQ